MYCIARSFVVERYGTNNEDFRELYGNCIKNNKIVEFFEEFNVNSSTFELEIVLICCRRLTQTTFLMFRGFNILVHNVYR